MSDDRGRDAGGGIDRYATVAQAVIAVASALALIFTVADRFAGNTTALVDVGIGALVVLYLVSVLWVARAMLRTRYYDFRIALTGQPGAGKTVFANLLYDRLMNGGDPDYRFTAESRSAIATYQAIRGISQDEWPPSTARGSVLQRDGLLRYRRAVVDLEIGDSAGQHWLQLAETSHHDASPRDADYLQWVLSAHALVHVIPADRLLDHGFTVTLRSDVEDLRLAAQLMRSTAKDRYEPVPILIVISKMDLVLPSPNEEDMMHIFSSEQADLLESTGRLGAIGGLDVAGLLGSLGKELEGEFRSVSFTYSSAELVKDLRSFGASSRSDVPAWVVAGASRPRGRLFAFLAPRRRAV